MLFPVTKREKGRKRRKNFQGGLLKNKTTPKHTVLAAFWGSKPTAQQHLKTRGPAPPSSDLAGSGPLLTLGISKLKYIFREGDARGALPCSGKADAGYSRVPQTFATASSSNMLGSSMSTPVDGNWWLPPSCAARVFFPATCPPELGTLIHYLTDISVLITFLENLFHVL